MAYNNLFYNIKNAPLLIGLNHDYSSFFNTQGPYEEAHYQNETLDPFTDWANNDYKLVSATHPGIQLTDPYKTDPYGNQRGADGVWDRGAYEYVEPESLPGDVNLDGRVNILDIQAIIFDFDKTSDYNSRSDQNNDGTINIFDIMIVVRNWD
jgi:hypothetical protein